jgi:Condensation domain
VAVLQRYVVSHAQRDLWSLQKLVPESAAHNVVSAWRIRSRVDDGALAEAFIEMANRHDALRTTYRERDGAVWAEVHDRVDGLRLVNARRTTDAEQAEARTLLVKIPYAATREDAERQRRAFQASCAKRGQADAGRALERDWDGW